MPVNNENNNTGAFIEVSAAVADGVQVHLNLKQNIIAISEDRLKLVLMETGPIIASKNDWQTPGGLLLSFIATLTTSEFKSAFGMDKSVWSAMFMLLSSGSTIWLLYSFWKLFKNRGKGGINDIISKIKEGGPASGQALVP